MAEKDEKDEARPRPRGPRPQEKAVRRDAKGLLVRLNPEFDQALNDLMVTTGQTKQEIAMQAFDLLARRHSIKVNPRFGTAPTKKGRR